MPIDHELPAQISRRLESIDGRLETIAAEVQALQIRNAAQMETLIGLARDTNELLRRAVSETIAEHTRRIATLEARLDRLEASD